jgi:tripeptide aminopeptidase
MEKVGITPFTEPIRGGTDGATLSFMGLPCPNICSGGHNYHGVYEFICKESMEKITGLLIAIALCQ